MKSKDARNAVSSSFLLVMLMELGDKTQFGVIALSAEYEFPLLVFTGAMMALALITGLVAIVGTALARVVPLKYNQLGSGIVFIVLGIAFLNNGVLGSTVLV